MATKFEKTVSNRLSAIEALLAMIANKVGVEGFVPQVHVPTDWEALAKAKPEDVVEALTGGSRSSPQLHLGVRL